MLSKSRQKYLRSLRQKKYRYSNGEMLLEGQRLLKQAISAAAPLREIFVSESTQKQTSFSEFESFATQAGIPIHCTRDSDLEHISETKNNQGLIGLCGLPKASLLDDTKALVVLDRISDPGNLGTILRTAAWFEIPQILLAGDCVDPYNSKVLRAGMGAHFYVSIAELATNQAAEFVQKYHLLLADMEGKELGTQKLKTDKIALVLGNEAHGIHKIFQQQDAERIAIPSKDTVESLNVSSAAAILFWELRAAFR